MVQQLTLDLVAAALEGRHDAAGFCQGGGVGVCVGERHRARAHEAVAQRVTAGGKAQRGHRHHGGAEQGDETVRRAHELDGRDAIGQLPSCKPAASCAPGAVPRATR
ncbi:hypothetical protein G6F68_016364 [Rhizopus microsporus]|nr:hypothetical protein G6F68_016364 [Rhizopus microsporus]